MAGILQPAAAGAAKDNLLATPEGLRVFDIGIDSGCLRFPFAGGPHHHDCIRLHLLLRRIPEGGARAAVS